MCYLLYDFFRIYNLSVFFFLLLRTLLLVTLEIPNLIYKKTLGYYARMGMQLHQFIRLDNYVLNYPPPPPPLITPAALFEVRVRFHTSHPCARRVCVCVCHCACSSLSFSLSLFLSLCVRVALRRVVINKLPCVLSALLTPPPPRLVFNLSFHCFNFAAQRGANTLTTLANPGNP